MAEQNRNSVMALMVEVTEGTPVVPTAGTDYIAMQAGFDLEPAFDVLENAELRSSIGKSKPITGLENPRASFSHYLRHSGVEGTAPNFKQLLKSAFGAENVNGTARTLAAASTTSVIKLTAGGTDFTRGRAILLKDGTNGYAIRPVDSVSTNDLTIGFNVGTAPAAGITTGKAVTYSPANSAHQALTVWNYRGNAGAVEAISGTKVTGMNLDVRAGELINASYEMEGVKFFFNPINILAADQYLDFHDGTDEFNASITLKLYRDPHELAAAIAAAMNTAAATTSEYGCTYNDSGASAGKFTFTKAAGTFSLLWNTGTNTANTIGNKIGFSVAADDSGVLTYTSDNAQSWVSPYTPSYDNADPLVAKNNEVLLGDASDTTSFSASSLTFSLRNTNTKIPDISAESGISGSIFSEREVEVNVVGLLTRHDVEKFKRFRANDETKFLFNFGTKTGGNWDAGKCGSLYLPSATISSFKLGDLDGLVTVEITLRGFVDSNGNGEVYLNFL